MAAPSLDDLPASFELYLRASSKSPRTIETYREALDGFTAHLQATSKRRRDEARRDSTIARVHQHGATLKRDTGGCTESARTLAPSCLTTRSDAPGAA
jgi:hypothetical protein